MCDARASVRAFACERACVNAYVCVCAPARARVCPHAHYGLFLYVFDLHTINTSFGYIHWFKLIYYLKILGRLRGRLLLYRIPSDIT